jgi:hypothetical protein
MEIYALVAVLLLVAYGLLTGYASFQQFKAQKIQPWAAIGMFGAALALLGTGFLLGEGSGLTLPLLLLALVGLHALAIVNGLHMFGKVNWRHHLMRAILSLALIVFTVLGLG